MGNYFESLFGDKLQVVCSAIAAFCAMLYTMAFGEGGEVVVIIIVATGTLFASDVVLGVTRAVREGRFSSKGFSRVLEKMVVYTIAVFGMTSFGAIVPAIPTAAGIEVPLEVVVASARGFFLWTILLIGVTEFISVVENLKCLGFRLPNQIYTLIKRVKERLWKTVPGVSDNDAEGSDDEQ